MQVLGVLDAPAQVLASVRRGCERLFVDIQNRAVPSIADGVGASLGAGYVLLAAYCAITELVGVESLVDAMRQLVPPYRTQHLVANEAALRAGFAAAPAGAASAWAEAVAP